VAKKPLEKKSFLMVLKSSGTDTMPVQVGQRKLRVRRGSDMESVKVKMARGGFMQLDIEGRAYSDSDGAGQSWTEVEIDSIQWPGGGEVAEKNIADMDQVREAFLSVLESNREG
jgi:hypothetical protein